VSPEISAWALAFGLTVLIEAPIVVAILRGPVIWPRALLIALGAQLITHPALWFIAPRFDPYWLWVGVMECAVTAVEAVLYAGLLRTTTQEWGKILPRAILASIAANAVSTGIGLAGRWMGWL